MRKLFLVFVKVFFVGFLSLAVSTAQAMPPEEYTLDALGIDLKTGAFTHSTQDIAIGPDGSPDQLVFSRFYNSHETDDRRLGRGWSHSFDVRAIKRTENSETYVLINIGMSTIRFTRVNSEFIPSKQDGSKLIDNGNSITYTDRSGTVATFITTDPSTCYSSSCNYIGSRIKKPNGEILDFSHSTSFINYTIVPNNIISVTSSLGWNVSFDFYSYNLIKSIQITNLSKTYCDDPEYLDVHCQSGVQSKINFSYTDGLLTRVTDTQGNTITYGYDTAGRLNSIKRPLSSSANRTIAYNSSGIVTSQTISGLGTWNYSMNGSRATITNPRSEVQTVEFGTSDVPVWMEDGLGRRTSFTYDSFDRLTKQTNPEGDYVEFTYDSRGNVTETRRYPKPGSGLAAIITRAGYPASCTTENVGYCNKPIWTEDAKGNRTNYEYDVASSGPSKIIFPADANGIRPEQRFDYEPLYAYFKNSSGTFTQASSSVYRLVSTTTCETNATCFGTASEVKTTFNYGPQSTTEGNNLALRSITQDPSGLNITTTFKYDDIGNLIETDGPLAGTADITYFRYDSERRQIGVINPDPDGGGALKRPATRFTYNADGFLISTEQGTVTGTDDTAWAAFISLQKQESAYDATTGYKTKDILSASGTTFAVQQYTYDELGRAECVAQRLNPGTFSSLPADACLLGATGAFGADRITKMVYDAAGQVTKQIAGVGTTLQQDAVTSTYTDNGQQATVTDAKGNKTTYEYDGFNRLVKLRYPDKVSVGSSSTTDFEQYSYDANGNVTSLRKRDGQVIAYTYDNLNRLTKKDLPGTTAEDVYYAYDLLGRTLSARFGSASGQGIINSYDKAGRLLSTSSYGRTLSYQYDTAGRRTRMTYPDAFYVSYVYDILGRLTEVRENGASSGLGRLAVYSYDDLGRRNDISYGNGTGTSYGFDAVSRLIQLQQDVLESGKDYSTTFTYSPASQIASETLSNDPVYAWTGHYNKTEISTHNGQNQVTAVGEKVITHDANGNVTGDGSSAFTYDVENKLVSVDGRQDVSFNYDPLGRLREIVSTSTTVLLYDGTDLVAEYSASGTLIRRYVHGPSVDEPIVWYEGSGTSDRRWYHADARGSIVAVTNASGLALETRSYSPYGEPDTWSGSRFQYTGQIAIPEAGLYYYKARFYAPSLGRFLQTDPIGYAAGLNLYAYVNGDTINRNDPSGLVDEVIEEIVTTGMRPMLSSYGDFFFNLFLQGVFNVRNSSSGPGGSEGGSGSNSEMSDEVEDGCNQNLIDVGNSLIRASVFTGDASIIITGTGLAVTFGGVVTLQPEVALAGVAVAQTGAAIGIGAGGLQVIGGLFQGFGGGGFDNAVNGAISLGAGAVLGRFFATPSGYRSAFERRLDKFVNNASAIMGGTIDVGQSLGSLAPREVMCMSGSSRS